MTSPELTQLAGAHHEWRPDLGGLVPLRDETMQTSVAGVYAVGDGAGVGGAALAMIEGQVAGLAAAAELGCLGEAELQPALGRLWPALQRERRFQRLYAGLFTPGPGLYALAQEETVICRCEEVTLGEMRQMIARGAETANEVKALTRCGMGYCQGRVCGQLVAHLVARETGRSVAEVGLFRTRPPIFPLPVQAFATNGILTDGER